MGDLSLIPGLGRSLGGGHGNPIQYSCPGESPWAEQPEWAAVHGVAKSWTQQYASETFPQNPRTLRKPVFKTYDLNLAFTLQVGKLRLQKVN